MICSSDSYVWSKHHLIPNINMTIIHQSKITVGIYSTSKVNMMSSPVSMKRQLYITSFSTFCKNLFHI